MAKAKLNTQHDYVTLSVIFDDGKRINLTTARYSEKCSAKVGYDPEAMKRTFKAFTTSRKLMEKGTFKTVGEWMDHMRATAETATSPTHLADLFEAIVAPKADIDPVKVVQTLEPQLKTLAKKVWEEHPNNPKNKKSDLTLEQAFDLVKNKKDWKARIDARINKEDAPRVLEAIAHYTGTAGYTKPHPTNPDKLIVRAAGYRAGPCGDK